MSGKKREKVPTYERYTIFNALLEVMQEKKQKKSRWIRFLQRLRRRG
ncbi:MAG: hypothetical protein ACQXXH_03705 [Candidatus Bathyarchaeia archaeon]|nr:hypothetical protein [Candidatus Bathyarchaeota archaeon A05DMB-4]MDH7594844.1 hypothetical protein [Candidatus Bathyarchaeota archaeon]